MKIIEMIRETEESIRYTKADMTFWTRCPYNKQLGKEGDIQAFYPSEGQYINSNDFVYEVQNAIKDNRIIAAGNQLGGCVSFHPPTPHDMHESVASCLKWADWTYKLAGTKMVFAPYLADLVRDINYCDASMFKWCAEKKVPLVIWMGFRLLFSDDRTDPNFPFKEECNRQHWKLRTPDDVRVKIKNIIEELGVEAWTGLGWLKGIKAGSIDLAKQYGFKGIMTSSATWLAYEAL